MDILIIGSVAREHALGWKLKKSPQCNKLYFASGNAGTAALGENVDLNIKDNKAVANFAKGKGIGLVVVATDDYLAQGMVDVLTEAGIKVFGPTKAAAQIEWSKSFAKDFMKRHAIPTAVSETFSSIDAALKYIDTIPVPIVIKADGLALGKGVVIAETKKEAEETLRSFMSGESFGESGRTVVIEEFLEGKEVSIHAFSDDSTIKLFPVSRDHKRINEGNMGPNTGGMGTIVPVPDLPKNFLSEVEEKIVRPTIKGMAAEGKPFRGVLYPGLMLTTDGPKVIEFNARFGDPECESYMRILESDLIKIMLSCINGTLADSEIRWSPEAAITVMLASQGYPGKYQKGFEICGIEEAEKDSSVVIFHAGTRIEEGKLVTTGGRVLGVSAKAPTLAEAREKAYAAAKIITFEGKQYRTDIGI